MRARYLDDSTGNKGDGNSKDERCGVVQEKPQSGGEIASCERHACLPAVNFSTTRPIMA